MQNLKKVTDFADKYGMLRGKKRIIAAVSGGTDSMCLLCMLDALRGAYGYELLAAHYNHGIRGADADRDEEFVKRECEKRGIPLICGHGDTIAYAAAHKIGTEEAGRILRYAFFEKTAVEYGADAVATAHNADDNAETFLMNAARGAGLNGLCGIPPTRGIYIRPLLTLTRREIEEYSESHGISHVEDATNGENIYTRNKIRHGVMPMLKEINGRFSENISSATELLRRDEELLSSLAEAFLQENLRDNRISVKALRENHISVVSRAIRKICPQAEEKHIRAILALCEDTASPSAEADVPRMTVRREYETLVFGKAETARWEPFTVGIGEERTIASLGLTVRCERCVFDGKIDKSFTTFVFPSGRICDRIHIRLRSSGDTVRPNRGSGRKTLKKLMTEKKIPASKRDTLPVLASGDKIIAVYSLCVDADFTPRVGDECIRIIFGEKDYHEG